MKSKRLDVRVSEAEKNQLMAKAGNVGLSLSEYLRVALLVGHIDLRVEHQLPVAWLTELSRIGNNLNQLARAANSGALLGEQDFFEVWRSLEELKEMISYGH